MNILVIGGSGFIGTHLVSRLIDAGHIVRIYDLNSSSKFPDLWVRGDVCNKNDVVSASKGMDLIVNLAAEHHDNVEPEEKYYDVNVGGAKNIIAACDLNSIRKIMFTSSVAVYAPSVNSISEKHDKKPTSHYGRSKLWAEKVFTDWKDSNLSNQLFIVRPTAVFGAGATGNVNNLINQIKNRRFIMIGNGENRKSIAYVENVADFLNYLISSEESVSPINYADKPDFSMLELVQFVRAETSDSSYSKLRIPYFVGLFIGHVADVIAKTLRRDINISSIRIKKFCTNSIIDTSKLRDTGFKPSFSIDEGLRVTVDDAASNS